MPRYKYWTGFVDALPNGDWHVYEYGRPSKGLGVRRSQTGAEALLQKASDIPIGKAEVLTGMSYDKEET